MRIQHNIPALNSYRNYSNNVSMVSKNLEKLSTGYKINRAGDDAAGLAISEKMRIQITGLEKAQDNAKAGINLVQTAEGALTEVHDMLNRMYDLAEQSANGTFDDTTDRKQLQKEIDSLRTEIDRIADSTNYNGIKLLDGSMENKTVASGAVNADKTQLNVIRDGQLAGKDPQPGIFSVDLSKVILKYTKAGATVDEPDNQATDGDDDDDKSSAEHKVDFTIMGNTVTVTLGEGEIGGDELAVRIAEAIKNGSVTKAGDDENTNALAGDDGDDDDDDSKSGLFEDADGNTYNVTAEGGVLRFTMTDFPIKGLADSELTLEFDPAKFGTTGYISNQGNQWNFKVEQEPVADGDGRIYAQAELKLDETIVKDGGTLTIGDETYVFAIGKNSVYKNYANVVDLTDKTKDSAELVRVAAGRLTQVAANNSSFYVGTNYAKPATSDDDENTQAAGDDDDDDDGEKGVVITLTEKEGAIDYSKNNLGGANSTSQGIYTDNDNVKGANDDDDTQSLANDDGDDDDETTTVNATAADWAGLIKIGNVDANKSTHGLTLQIGDTAESFNQLKVSVADMHTVALGLDKIDISQQGNAQKAMDAIKKATNMVSDVRGGLGAIQNRLDHTINNLSVAQENIQDAESNIRDVDVAKEMMNYTKNNILVQSAQAMLAQANQLPQGVLQLLG